MAYQDISGEITSESSLAATLTLDAVLAGSSTSISLASSTLTLDAALTGEVVSKTELTATALLDEQFLYDRANAIVLLDVAGDYCSEELNIEAVLITGAAGGGDGYPHRLRWKCRGQDPDHIRQSHVYAATHAQSIRHRCRYSDEGPACLCISQDEVIHGIR